MHCASTQVSYLWMWSFFCEPHRVYYCFLATCITVKTSHLGDKSLWAPLVPTRFLTSWGGTEQRAFYLYLYFYIFKACYHFNPNIPSRRGFDRVIQMVNIQNSLFYSFLDTSSFLNFLPPFPGEELWCRDISVSGTKSLPLQSLVFEGHCRPPSPFWIKNSWSVKIIVSWGLKLCKDGMLGK